MRFGKVLWEVDRCRDHLSLLWDYKNGWFILIEEALLPKDTGIRWLRLKQCDRGPGDLY